MIVKKDLRRVLVVFVLTYILLLFIIDFGGYKEYIPLYMHSMKFILGLNMMGCISLSFSSMNFKNICIISSFLFFLLSSLLRLLYIEYEGVNMPFGPSYDSYAYFEYADNYSDISLGKFIDSILFNGFNIDDLGYFFLVWILRVVSGNIDLTSFLMLIVNAICVFISASYIGKTVYLIMNNELLSRFAALVYCSFPFLIVTSACGLKECVFTMFISIALYNIQRLRSGEKTMRVFVFLFLSIIACYFFRQAISAMLILTMIVSIIKGRYFKTMYPKYLLTSLFFCGFLLSIVMPYLFGTSLDRTTAIAEARLSGTSNEKIGMIVNIMSGLIGPFPILNKTGSYGIMHSSGLWLKNLLAIFSLLSVFRALFEKNWRLYPFITYYLFNLLMFIIAGVALDMRYHITMFPVYLVFVCYALDHNLFKLNVRYYTYVLCFIVVVIIYSNR